MTLDTETYQRLETLLADHATRQREQSVARRACPELLSVECRGLLHGVANVISRAGHDAEVKENNVSFRVRPESLSLTLLLRPNGRTYASALTFACEREGLACWTASSWPLRQVAPVDGDSRRWIIAQVLTFVKGALDAD